METSSSIRQEISTARRRTAVAGPGTIFELTPNQDGSSTKSLLYSFKGSDGGRPMAGLTLDQAGNFYGMTYGGGNSGAGTRSELSPNQDGRLDRECAAQLHGQRRGQSRR